MSDPTDLQTLALDLLAASRAALDGLVLFGLKGAPAVRYVSPGQPAFEECEQLTVHFQNISESMGPRSVPLGRTPMMGRLNLVYPVITITRCLPLGDEGEPPLAADLQTVAAQTNADAWAIWNHLYNLVRAHLLLSFCKEVFWDGMRSVVPQGGYGGWHLDMRVELDGYQETFGT